MTKVANVTSATILNKIVNLLNSHPVTQIISVLRNIKYITHTAAIFGRPQMCLTSNMPQGHTRLRVPLADKSSNIKFYAQRRPLANRTT